MAVPSWIATPGQGQADRQPVDRREQGDREVQPVRDRERAHVDHGRNHEQPGEADQQQFEVNVPLNIMRALEGPAFQFVTGGPKGRQAND